MYRRRIEKRGEQTSYRFQRYIVHSIKGVACSGDHFCTLMLLTRLLITAGIARDADEWQLFNVDQVQSRVEIEIYST